MCFWVQDMTKTSPQVWLQDHIFMVSVLSWTRKNVDCSGLILTQSQFSSNLSPDSGLSELVSTTTLLKSILEMKIN